MPEKRKFAQLIIKNSLQIDEKECSNKQSDIGVSHFGWGSCIPEPVDYENFIAKHKASIKSDPCRELLLFPAEDVKITRLPHIYRVPNAGVPSDALLPGVFTTNPLGRHSISNLVHRDWTCVHQPSAQYRGHYCKLPRTSFVENNVLVHQSDYRFSIDLVNTTPKPLGGIAVLKSGSSALRPRTVAAMVNRSQFTSGDVSLNNDLSKSASRSSLPSITLGSDIHQDGIKFRNAALADSIDYFDGSSDNKAPVDSSSVDKSILQAAPSAECSLAVGSRELYSSYLHSRECISAVPQSESHSLAEHQSVKPMKLHPYCFRLLKPDELCVPSITVDKPKQTGIPISEAGSTAGSYVIAPVTWKGEPLCAEREQVILLDLYEAVHPIGNNWLKLDRPLFNCRKSKETGDETFIYFDQSVGGAQKRLVWLRLIQAVLNRTRSLKLVSSRSAALQCPPEDIVRPQNVSSGEQSEVSSIKNLLQQCSRETDYLVNHSRQKDRLKLITVHPEVRLPFNDSVTAAYERSLRKAATSASRSGSSCTVTDGRTTRIGSKPGNSLHLYTPLPFADRTEQLCSHRFLATFLSLKSRGLALVNSSDPRSAPQLDNPEPFFVTMFLVNAIDGHRVSEDFYWNPNSPTIDSMIPEELYKSAPWSNVRCGELRSIASEASSAITVNCSPHGKVSSSAKRSSRIPTCASGDPPTIETPLGIPVSFKPETLAQCRSAVFFVPQTSHALLTALYLVVRVDKVLSGSVVAATEKYLKALDDKPGTRTLSVENKFMTYYHRYISTYCRCLGRYRMPFAWGARSLSSHSSRFPLFKVEQNKLSESTLINLVRSFARFTESCTSNGNPTNFSGSVDRRTNVPTSLTNVSSCVDDVSIEQIERNLKLSSIPIQLDVVVSELVDQSSNSELQTLRDFHVLSPDLLTVTNIETSCSSPLLAIPHGHPRLAPHELIREVEHMWDFRANSGSFGEVAAVDDPVLDQKGLTDRSLSVSQWGSRPTSFDLQDVGPNKSNRDSFVSTSTTSSSTGIPCSSDTHPASNLFLRARTGSLDRPNSRPGAESLTRVPLTTTFEAVPFTTFVNSLFISSKSVNLSVKHNFPRARNLSCFIELRCSDDLLPSSTLKVFQTRPSSYQPPFDLWFNTAVIYHETSPRFPDLAKVFLPLHLTARHHLLFRFYHVSVDTAGSTFIKERTGKKPLEAATGYAWLPILGPDWNVNSGVFNLPVAMNIQPGYLSLPSPTNRIPSSPAEVDAIWLDGGKPLFNVQLDSLSSLHTYDPVLSRFFRACGTLLSRILYLPSPLDASTAKVKANRVTFLDGLVESNAASPVAPCENRPTINITLRSTHDVPGLQLCNAVKALLLIDKTALLQFFPSLFNQFMEVVLISGSLGHRWSPTTVEETNPSQWMYPFKSQTYNTSNELLKTSFITMAELLSLLVTTPSDCNLRLPRLGWSQHSSLDSRHPVPRAYVKFAFDAISISADCESFYASQLTQEQRTQVQCPPNENPVLSLPLHHSLVRGAVLLLADYNGTHRTLVKFFKHLWFPLALISKSMTQYLVSTQKIKADRSGCNRFSVSFSTDLTLFIKLVGTCLASSVTASRSATLSNPASTCSTLERGISSSSVGYTSTQFVGQGDRMMRTNYSTSACNRNGVISGCSVDAEDGCEVRSDPGALEKLLEQTSQRAKLARDINHSEVMFTIARFLGNLFNLMDRGYMMNRCRDLLIVLEALPHMSIEEIDALNTLRLELLDSLSHHEFFVQLNLPLLNSHRGIGPTVYDIRLTDQFIREHFLVGSLLSTISCLLSGCVETGSWAAGQTPNHLHRRPLLLLRNLLAKHCLDPRYATSKSIQARIATLYLPLVFMVLENPTTFGPPGGALKAAVNAARKELSDRALADTSSSVGQSDRHKSKLLTDPLAKLPGNTSRPSSIFTDSSGDTLSAKFAHSTSSSCSSSVISGNGSIISHATGSSSSSRSSAPYLTKEDKVAPHILHQIAGVPMRQRRRNSDWPNSSFTSCNRRDVIEPEDNSNSNLVSSHTSSTLTLTDQDLYNGAPPENGGHAINGSAVQSDNIQMVDDFMAESDPEWGNQLLALVGVVDHDSVVQRLPPSGPAKCESPPKTLLSHVNVERRRPSSSSVHVRPHQHRLPNNYPTVGPRRLTDKCQRELFICLLHILSTVTDEHLVSTCRLFTTVERITFLNVLNLAVQHIRYRGKRCILKYEHISRSGVGRVGVTAGSTGPGLVGSSARSSECSSKRSTLSVIQSGCTENALNELTNDEDFRVILEANVATESGLIVLDLLHVYDSVFRHELESCRPKDPLFKGMVDVYISLLTNNPSDRLIQHTFAALRIFVGRYAKVLFSEPTDTLNVLCLAALRFCNDCGLSLGTDPPKAVQPEGVDNGFETLRNLARLEACGFLYKLWKSSFEIYGMSGFNRVHLQIIISVSKLVNEIDSEFGSILSLLHQLVDSDMRLCATSKFWSDAHTRRVFVEASDDLICRVRTVLTSTVEMHQHKNDHERLVDLHYRLAKSYSSNPALRRTWLEELAKLHISTQSFAELAMVKLHITALMTEYLRKRGHLKREFPRGCESYGVISSNICREESGLHADAAVLEIPYTQDDLLVDINEAAVTLESAGLYEAVRPVYSLVLPVYEARHDFTALAQIYHHIGRSYENIGRSEAVIHRLFASYFKVAFYGKAFESLNGKSYIYRVSACKQLSDIGNELLHLYQTEYHLDSVQLITEYHMNVELLGTGKCYIQVVFVEPYVLADPFGKPPTSYEKHHDVCHFMVDTPFVVPTGSCITPNIAAAGPKRSEDLTVQWIRRSILTTEATFPHLRKRLEIVSTSVIDLSPIDVAIEGIAQKNQDLSNHINRLSSAGSRAADSGHPQVTGSSMANKSSGIPLIMDMQLQGALLTTVHMGPMAYAEAFLRSENQSSYSKEKVARLRELFFEFLTTCLVLLTIYQQRMSNIHAEKYRVMRQALDRYRVDLSNLLKEEVVIDEKRLTIGPRSNTID